MAVTLNPAGSARQGDIYDLSSSTLDDPTYIPLNRDRRNEELLLVIINLSGSAQEFSFADYSDKFENISDSLDTTNVSLATGALFTLFIYPWQTRHLIDESADPPQIELTGANLTNLKGFTTYPDLTWLP